MNIDDRIRKTETKFLQGDKVVLKYDRDWVNREFEEFDGKICIVTNVRGNRTNDYLYMLRPIDQNGNETGIEIYAPKEGLTMVEKRRCSDEPERPKDIGFEW